MEYNKLLVEANGEWRPVIPLAISLDLTAIQNSINIELIKLKSDRVEIEAGFDWYHDISQRIWFPLLGFEWSSKNSELDRPTGKFQLDAKATEDLLNNPPNVIADRIHTGILTIAGLTRGMKMLVTLDNPETGIYATEEYGDGFFFDNHELDHPDINLATKPFADRMNEINEYLISATGRAIKSKLCWEWHCARHRWYPRVAISFDGSEFNLLTFNLDYSYRILTGKDLETVQGLLASALKSITALKT